MISTLWKNASSVFEPVQYLFNGNFWKEFQKKFGKFEGKAILDLACGTGELVDYITPKFYLGIDFNKSYINFAQKNRGNKHISFLHGDITSFSTERKFECALLISAAHHLSDQQLEDVAKAVKRQGVKKLVVIDGYPIGPFKEILKWLDSFLAGGNFFRSEHELADVLKRHFRIKESGNFTANGSTYNYPYVIAFQ